MGPLFAFDSPGPFSALAPPPVAGDAPAPTRAQVERALMDDGPAQGYRPSLPVGLFNDFEHDTPPLYRFYWDLPRMLMHPRVSLALSYVLAGSSNAEFEVTASSPAVQRFVEDELDRFWHRSLFQAQEPGVSWGWSGCQAKYTRRQALSTSLWSGRRRHSYDRNDATSWIRLHRHNRPVPHRIEAVNLARLVDGVDPHDTLFQIGTMPNPAMFRLVDAPRLDRRRWCGRGLIPPTGSAPQRQSATSGVHTEKDGSCHSTDSIAGPSHTYMLSRRVGRDSQF